MANEKISAMPSAFSFSIGDVLPIVAGGVNYKCIRDVFNSIATGEYWIVQSNTGYIYFDDTPDFELNMNFGGVINWLYGGVGVLAIDNAGNFILQPYPGGDIQIVGNGATISIGNSGKISLIPAIGSVAATYIPSNLTDWSGVSPGTFAQALDRIARWFTTSGVGPIP